MRPLYSIALSVFGVLLFLPLTAVSQPSLGSTARAIASPPVDSEARSVLARFQPAFDRIETDVNAFGAVAATIQDGRVGTSSLVLAEQGRVRLLDRTGPDERLCTPVWSPGGDRIAYARRLRPLWINGGEGPMLQWQGQLLWAAPGATARQMNALRDAARVLGWADDMHVIVTRTLPGDMPEERPYRVDLRTGVADPLAPAAAHVYNIAWIGGRLVYARSEQPVLGLPVPSQRLDVVEAGRDGRSERIVFTETGVMPTGFQSPSGSGLAWVLEGRNQMRLIAAETGAARTIDLTPFGVIAPERALMDLMVMPYIHQVYDTPDEFNGHWACGPTSTVMAVCHWGKLDPWPVTVSIPQAHTSNYGAYVSRKYTAYGTTFDRAQNDASGNPAQGAYGWCTEGGAAWAWRMQDYAVKHELHSDFFDQATMTDIQSHLDQGQVVVLSTNLTSAGHIIAVKGYTSDKLIVNDPYGDKNQGYMNYNGEGAQYTWATMDPKWFITVWGDSPVVPPYKATLVAQDYPQTMTSGQIGEASITYKNEGSATWDDSTRLGTTVPKDRASEFFTSGHWINAHRPAKALATTATGAQATFSFKLTAPNVCSPTQYVEHFNLVQEGTAWFSDSGQGGPADDAVWFKITVQPAPGDCADGGAADGGVVDSAVDSADSGKQDTADGAGSPTGDASPGLPADASDDGCSCRAAPPPAVLALGPWSWMAAIALAFMKRRSC